MIRNVQTETTETKKNLFNILQCLELGQESEHLPLHSAQLTGQLEPSYVIHFDLR